LALSRGVFIYSVLYFNRLYFIGRIVDWLADAWGIIEDLVCEID
jgi:hypothetical protein